MKLGTHNSMTFLKPYRWYLYPFNFIARCQSKSFEEQYDIGVRLFDVRIKFDKDNNPYFIHGLMRYKGMDIYDLLDFLEIKGGCYIIISLEITKPNTEQENLFINFCESIINKYKNINIGGGGRKYDWKNIFNFNNKPYTVDQKFRSLTHPKSTIYPRFWAWKNNKKYLQEGTDKDFLQLDFV